MLHECARNSISCMEDYPALNTRRKGEYKEQVDNSQTSKEIQNGKQACVNTVKSSTELSDEKKAKIKGRARRLSETLSKVKDKQEQEIKVQVGHG